MVISAIEKKLFRERKYDGLRKTVLNYKLCKQKGLIGKMTYKQRPEINNTFLN